MTPASPSFLYVKVPVDHEMSSPGHVIEERIDQALCERAMGCVLGWGSSLGEADEDGRRHVAFHRIDIEVADQDVALELLRRLLPELGMPAGTEIHYRHGTTSLQDVYSGSAWALEQRPRG